MVGGVWSLQGALCCISYPSPGVSCEGSSVAISMLPPGTVPLRGGIGTAPGSRLEIGGQASGLLEAGSPLPVLAAPAPGSFLKLAPAVLTLGVREALLSVRGHSSHGWSVHL